MVESANPTDASPVWVWVKTPALDQVLIGKARKLSTRSSLLLLKVKLHDSEKDSVESDNHDVNWGWTHGTIAAAEGSDSQSSSEISVTVLDELSMHNNKSANLPADSFETGDIVMDNVYENDDYPDDLVALTHLHEPAVVMCLKKRFEAGKIYTDDGPKLIALNPFKECPHLYSKSVMEDYWKR
eukprot:14770079-Ditylum_brightwellii.AAC.1